ncbi:MAG TPA: hypothetical protein VG738_24175 [Chitinophagaceae bacterium]|nr:hypothetical protein [Chitinophagaceae bacterium]
MQQPPSRSHQPYLVHWDGYGDLAGKTTSRPLSALCGFMLRALVVSIFTTEAPRSTQWIQRRSSSLGEIFKNSLFQRTPRRSAYLYIAKWLFCPRGDDIFFSILSIGGHSRYGEEFIGLLQG